jgi:hypothetical protein|tara:strand:+ start:183 stop:434 length:252 start_codon:yes stop_codon:yes gene_type:complete
MAGDNVVAKIKGAVSSVVDVVWALLALGIVLQVLFGPDVLFLPVDVIGNITDLVNSLGGAGLSGLVTIGVIYWIFSDNSPRKS